jgi:hypothetical protein
MEHGHEAGEHLLRGAQRLVVAPGANGGEAAVL